MFINRCYENENTGVNMNNTNTMNNMAEMPMMGGQGCACQPIMECPQERVCHRQMCYEVPHDCPFLVDLFVFKKNLQFHPFYVILFMKRLLYERRSLSVFTENS